MARTNADVIWKEARQSTRNPFKPFLWDFEGWREDRKTVKKGWDLCEECAEVYRSHVLAWSRNDARTMVWMLIGFGVFFETLIILNRIF